MKKRLVIIGIFIVLINCINALGETRMASMPIIENSTDVGVSIQVTDSIICIGSSVTFTATPINGGTNLNYQWTLNGTNVGTNSSTYTSTTLNNNDVVNCVLTSSNGSDTPVSATSNNITMMVNPLPIVNVINQTVCSGLATQTISFSGTGTGYSWTSSNPSIGLAASGTGDINSFIPINNGTTPIIDTITVIPSLLLETGTAYFTAPYATDNLNSSALLVINLASHTLIASIPMDYFPANACPSPDGKKVYVSDPNANLIYVINTATNKVIATISGINSPMGLCISPDGKYLYTAGYLSGIFSTIDCATNLVVGTIPVGGGSFEFYMSSNGEYVYAFGPGGVEVINTISNTAVAGISTGSSAISMCLSPDGSRIYLADNISLDISVISTSTNTVIATIPMEFSPSGINGLAISPDGGRLYICGSKTYIMDTNTYTFSSIPEGAGNRTIISPDGNRIYAIGDSFFSEVDLTTNKVISGVSVGDDLFSFAIFFGNPVSCTGIPQTFTITVNPTSTPSVNIVSSTNNICAGTSVTFTANSVNGGTNPSYQWTLNGLNVGNNSPTYTSNTLKNNDVVNCIMTNNLTCASSPTTTSNSITMIVKSNSTSTANISICTSDLPYVWNGNNYTTTGTYIAHLTNSVGCDSLATLNLTVNPAYNKILNDTTCQNESYVKNGFNLPQQTEIGNKTYTLTLKTHNGCDSTFVLNLVVLPNNLIEETVSICDGNTYQFYGEELSKSGVYTKNIETKEACETHQLNLTVNQNPLITGYQSQKTIGNVQVELNYSGGEPPYLFTLDDKLFSSNGLFSNLLLGKHTAKITDVNDCQSEYIFVLDEEIVPAPFFSPNGDGLNDRWTIENIEQYPQMTVFIYDRFGKELAIYHGYENATGWDGTYMGTNCPSTDYWYFIINDITGKSYTGHFSLIRSKLTK